MGSNNDQQARVGETPPTTPCPQGHTNIFDFASKKQFSKQVEICQTSPNVALPPRGDLRPLVKITNRQNRLKAASAEISQTLKDEHLKNRLEYYHRSANKVIRLETFKKS